MSWKVIGQSVIGTSHIQSGKTCEDAINYRIVNAGTTNEVLIAFVSDGAGSAAFAAQASSTAVQQAVTIAKSWLTEDVTLDDTHLLQLAETIYDELNRLADEQQVPLNEFSCTLLGCIILPEQAGFLQIGDGAIIRDDGSGHYTYLWWPHNGEYQNTTAFLIDDPNFKDLKIKIINEPIEEVALFTDGIQQLALNNERQAVHQPFFTDLFKWLRMASTDEHVAILDQKLTEYLSGNAINSRTDDDKTLLLATKRKHDNPADV